MLLLTIGFFDDEIDGFRLDGMFIGLFSERTFLMVNKAVGL